MTTTHPEHILWLDLETTALNLYAEEAAILEVGAIITSWSPELPVLAKANMLIRPSGAREDYDLLWTKLDPYVQQMHSTNGLWSEATTSEDGWAIHDADPALLEWITETTKSRESLLPLAGSGVAHMDLPWVRYFLPRVATRLTYWCLDIGVQRRLMELAGRPDHVDMAADVDAKTHRALEDVTLHVAEARRYLALLGRLPTVEAV